MELPSIPLSKFEMMQELPFASDTNQTLFKRTRISVPIVSIKFIKNLKKGEMHSIALRTRRPPKITTAVVKADELGSPSSHPQFSTSIDPSDCEAFATPTAYISLTFALEHDLKAASSMLQDFKVRIHQETRRVSQLTSSLTIPSHHLPLPDSSLNGLLLRAETEAEDDSFQIQYALECLLKHGLLRQSDVEDLLEKLLDLYRWGEGDTPSRELEDLVVYFPPVHRCNRGFEAFQKVCACFPNDR
jgi:hypothetical protein